MAPVSLSPLGNSSCSPKPSSASEIIVQGLEEGRVSASQESTQAVMNYPTLAHKVLAELVGTYIIIFVGSASVIMDKVSPPLALMGFSAHLSIGPTVVGVGVTWGLSIMVMIYALGHVSGGHFNPAVTIAFAASAKMPWCQVPAYIGSQLIASTLAICTLKRLLHPVGMERFTVTRYVYPPTTAFEAFLWEFIISFILMLTICGVATDSRAINELSGVAVGAAALVNSIVAGNITGASMNPARSLGAALVNKEFNCLWVYILGPILGATTACVFYSLLRLPKQGKSEENLKS